MKVDPAQRSKELRFYYRNRERLNAEERAKHRDRRSSTGPRIEAFQAWMDFVKLEPCKDCGGRFAPEAMDFDHVRGTKLRGIGQMQTASKKTLFDEMQKCELVCANCHRVRTRKRRGKPDA